MPLNQTTMFQDNQPQQPEQPTPPEQPVAPGQPQAQQTMPQAAPKSASPTTVPEKTTQEERMWAAISYIAFLGIVALAIKPKSAFCKHHAAQGLTIFVLWFISLILLAMPSFIGAIGGILLLGTTGLAIFGIIKAIQSYKLEVPILSSIAEKIPTDSIIGSVTGKTPETTKASNDESKPAEETVSQENPVQTVPEQAAKEVDTTPPRPQEPAQSEITQTQGTQESSVQTEGEKQKTPPETPPQA